MPTPKKYATYYDESKAVLVSESRQVVETTGVALRTFKGEIDLGEIDAIINEMWATRLYVDNPVISRQAGNNDLSFKLAGRWRVASLRKGGVNEAKGVYEELRLGWLQPPGTAGAYPPSKDANDWSGIDAAARVVRINEYSDANRSKSGMNRKYSVVIPGVATATVKEFCKALAARAPLTNPIFGLQTALAGGFAFGGVRNEDQGDGSSIVVATLAQNDGFKPGSILLNDNWNETIVHLLYKNLASFPDGAPATNITAVDDPGNWRNQSRAAMIYHVTGAELNPEDGLWDISVEQQTAKPSIVEWFVNNAGGAYIQVLFWNQTLSWLQNYTTLVLSANNHNQVHPPQRNEFDLYSGHFAIYPTAEGYFSYYSTGWFYENHVVFRHDHSGKYIREVWRLMLRRRFGGMRSSTNNHEGLTSVPQGMNDFYTGSDGPGLDGGASTPGDTTGSPPLKPWSSFLEIGGGQYRFTRVVKAELITADATNAYDQFSRGADLKTMVASAADGEGGALPTS